MEFPKLKDSSFPHLQNVDVYKFANDFDYSRYDAVQMSLQVCTVPWDMGEAHIGNRTISGIGNVVWFGTKAKRDAWFDAIPNNQCYRFETKYKELHRDHVIDVPIPYDMCAHHNYLVVKYNLFANDESPVMYESSDGMREWFWFIREVEFIAPNTTRLHLLEDAWQTWIYDVDITGMVLERGHAPMFATKVANYLANPIDNASMLLTDDVNYGNDTISRSQSEFVFNSGNMYALIVTTATPKGNFGSKSDNTWKTPGAWAIRVQSVPAYYCFAVAVADLSMFLQNINANYPQFVQTMKAIAFVSDNLITRDDTPFTFANTTCWNVVASYVENDLIHLTKSMFGYDAKYADIAKLYTYPYSYILVSDENGNQTEVHIETTNGTLKIESVVSLVFPWLTINSHLYGIGKGNKRNITFTNATNRNMPIQGNWYDTLMSWNIPTFGVYQDAGISNDYGTHFDRLQAATAANNAYSNVVETADCVVDNADLTATTNTAVTGVSNTGAYEESTITQGFNNSIAGADNTMTANSATSTIAANEEQATIAATSSAASGAVGAIGALANGDVLGAATSAVNAIIGAETTMASTAVGNGLTAANAAIAQAANSAHASLANQKTGFQVDNQVSVANDIADYQNDLTTGSAANTAAMQIANGGRDLSTAQSAIANQIAQSKLNAPNEFGAWNYGDLAVSRPMGLFANVVTQTDSAISAAGDEMLRYGYMYNKQWQFDGNWNIGKHYTYWKLSDFWVRGLNVPDMYMDRLRFFLFGGVTVWRKPEDIGNTSIYENM